MNRPKRFAIVGAALVALWALFQKLGWKGRSVTVTFGLIALVAVVWALGSLFSQAAVRAPVYYVDVDSIGGTCSTYSEAVARNAPTKPFCSLSQADTVVQSGGHILVREGIYPHTTILNAGKTSVVRVRPYPGETPTFRGLYLDNSDFWHFTNFELTGFDGTYCATPCYEPSGRVTIDDSNNITIAGWHIHDTISGVVTRTAAVREITIASNLIEDVDCMAYSDDCPGGQAGYGIASVGTFSRVRILNNTIRGTDGDAFQAGCQHCEIKGNLIYDIRVSPGNFDHADPFQFSGGAVNVSLIGNRVYDANKGIFFAGATSQVSFRGIVIADNLIYNIATVCLEIPRAENVVIRNNNCWGTGTGASYDPAEDSGIAVNSSWRVYNNIWGPTDDINQSTNLRQGCCGITFEKNNIVGENGNGYSFDGSDFVVPSQSQLNGLFTNEPADDYTLASGSIAVNAGTVADVLSRLDVARRSRLVGTVDIGAYERP